MTENRYNPGDVVNGHVLGSDNQWHPVAPQEPQRVYTNQVITTRREGTPHATHLLLTVCTCGLWFPVWILDTLIRGFK